MQKYTLYVCIFICLVAVGNCHFWNKWFTSSSSSSEEDSRELKDIGFFDKWLNKAKKFGSELLPKIGIRYAWKTNKVCKYVRCYSYWNDYDKCDIPKYGQVSSISVHRKKASSFQCLKGYSYGLDDNKIWVRRNCKAVFTVCYGERETKTTPTTDETSTAIPTTTTGWVEKETKLQNLPTTIPPSTTLQTKPTTTTTTAKTTPTPSSSTTTTTTQKPTTTRKISHKTSSPTTTTARKPLPQSTKTTKATHKPSPSTTTRKPTKQSYVASTTTPEPKPECGELSGFCSPVCPESYPSTDEAVCQGGFLCCHMPVVNECGAPPYSGSSETGYSIIVTGTQDGDEAVYRCADGSNKGDEQILECADGVWKPAVNLRC